MPLWTERLDFHRFSLLFNMLHFILILNSREKTRVITWNVSSGLSWLPSLIIFSFLTTFSGLHKFSFDEFQLSKTLLPGSLPVSYQKTLPTYEFKQDLSAPLFQWFTMWSDLLYKLSFTTSSCEAMPMPPEPLYASFYPNWIFFLL